MHLASLSPAKPPAGGVPRAVPDQLSSHDAALLRAALLRQPEIRPAEVARARALLADPEYPPISVVRSIAQKIIASPDPSEERAR
jgi:hypothetical protein